jgi:ATP-binding cassette subfamily B protein
MNNKLSFIDLVLFNTLMYYVIDPIKNLISYIPKINFLRASFRKICDFIDIEEEILGSNEKFINGDILYKDISFSYNGYNENIKNFNLNIKCGEKLLIKGKSGSGKSTICNLLTRFYNPLKGSIYIANKNILDYNINTIRNNIVYVGQKEKLYSDTIKNNILFGNSKTLDFDKVCKVCLIEDIVNKKQFRYDFGIDNNFANLSGGEKQRIILARALLQNKKIIILDEALSELDYNLERRIIDNIKKEYKESTIIYISHKNQDDLFDRVINFEEVNGVYQL